MNLTPEDKTEMQKQLDKAALLYADCLRGEAELKIWANKLNRSLKDVLSIRTAYEEQLQKLEVLLKEPTLFDNIVPAITVPQ